MFRCCVDREGSGDDESGFCSIGEGLDLGPSSMLALEKCFLKVENAGEFKLIDTVFRRNHVVFKRSCLNFM
jgi:hypothetical protein